MYWARKIVYLNLHLSHSKIVRRCCAQALWTRKPCGKSINQRTCKLIDWIERNYTCYKLCLTTTSNVLLSIMCKTAHRTTNSHKPNNSTPACNCSKMRWILTKNQMFDFVHNKFPLSLRITIDCLDYEELPCADITKTYSKHHKGGPRQKS